jgi:hypothetical protein
VSLNKEDKMGKARFMHEIPEKCTLNFDHKPEGKITCVRSEYKFKDNVRIK